MDQEIFGMGWSGFKICCGSGIWRELAWVKNFTGVRIRYSNCIYSESQYLRKMRYVSVLTGHLQVQII